VSAGNSKGKSALARGSNGKSIPPGCADTGSAGILAAGALAAGVLPAGGSKLNGCGRGNSNSPASPGEAPNDMGWAGGNSNAARGLTGTRVGAAGCGGNCGDTGACGVCGACGARGKIGGINAPATAAGIEPAGGMASGDGAGAGGTG
jgi:hypothetical protein